MSDLKTISEEGGGWNSEQPHILVSEVTGELKKRVLRRFGLKRGKVTISEETYYGGYSEYTQENSTSFTICVGKHEVEFEADEGDGIENRSTSVFARFHAWLRATEDPSALIEEWFIIEPDENGRHLVREDTMLFKSLRRMRYAHEFYLRLGDTSELNGVRVYDSGFRGLERLWGFTLSASSLEDDAQKIACAVTDYVMPRGR